MKIDAESRHIKCRNKQSKKWKTKTTVHHNERLLFMIYKIKNVLKKNTVLVKDASTRRPNTQ